MSLLETIISAQGGKLLQNMASNNGIDQNDALSVLGKLVPGLSRGMQKNTRQPEGLEALLNALLKGNHQQYVDNDAEAFSDNARQDGNNILGHLLGSKDASRSLAGQVASETSVDSGIIKKMLPQVATMLMGAMSKQSQSGGALNQLSGMMGKGQGNAATGLLTSFLDRDNDGSIVDDLMAMAAKSFFR